MAKAGRIVKEGSASEIASRISAQPNFFITAVTRLPSVEADAFRQKLFTSKSRLFMVKRRLGKRAVEPLKLAGLSELLEGSVGLVFSGDDALQTAKLIVEFRKAHEEQLRVLGAVIDGRLWDTARVEQLAALPPKPVLLAQVLGTIEAPLADVIFTIERLIGDLAWIAEQVAATKPPTEAGTPPAGGVAEGSAEERSSRPTEAGTPAASLGEAKRAGVADGSPDAAGGGNPPTPEQQTPKPGEGKPS